MHCTPTWRHPFLRSVTIKKNRVRKPHSPHHRESPSKATWSSTRGQGVGVWWGAYMRCLMNTLVPDPPCKHRRPGHTVWLLDPTVTEYSPQYPCWQLLG
jgi:hypothetical protein